MSGQKKILLLEDDKVSARLVSNFLEKQGYQVHESREGRGAIEQALREKPDLMIVDVLLPDMHGSDAVKQLRATEALHDLKVIFLTGLLGKSGGSVKETRLTVAGREYPALPKPFRPELLGNLVERVLAGDN